MKMNMFEILQERLPDGLTIVSSKELNAKYKITFEYEGTQGTAELSKTCAPGYHKEVADSAIITAMSSILIKKGDYAGAKTWLDRLHQG